MKVIRLTETLIVSQLEAVYIRTNFFKASTRPVHLKFKIIFSWFNIMVTIHTSIQYFNF